MYWIVLRVLSRPKSSPESAELELYQAFREQLGSTGVQVRIFICDKVHAR